MEKREEMTARVMGAFAPLDEESQKDLLFILIDCYLHHEGKKAKKDMEMAATYLFLIGMLTVTDMEKEIGFPAREPVLKDAREIRKAWERGGEA